MSPTTLSYRTGVHLGLAMPRRRVVSSGEADPFDLDDLIWRIKHNELKVLRLGFSDTRHFVKNTRQIYALEKALETNTSIQEIDLGWMFAKRDYVTRILKALSNPKQHTQNNSSIISSGRRRIFSIVLWEAVIPEAVLLRIIAQQKDNLVRLEFYGVHLDAHSILSIHKGGNLISQMVEKLNSHQMLKELKLQDCNIDDARAVQLAELLHIRGGIRKLSLRSNRHLGEKGLTFICQAPIMEEIDLSLCDIDEYGAMTVARSIARRPWPLQRLVMAGNFRMETEGILSLLAVPVCRKLVELNIGFCDVGVYRARLIFNALSILQDNDDPSIMPLQLKRVSMQGCLLNALPTIDALCTLIRANTGLRYLDVTNPTTRKCISPQYLQRIYDSMETSYQIEGLKIDTMNSTVEEHLIWRDMEWIFRLNRAGRRYLLEQSTHRQRNEDEEWIQILINSSSDVRILHWMLRNGATEFEKRYL